MLAIGMAPSGATATAATPAGAEAGPPNLTATSGDDDADTGPRSFSIVLERARVTRGSSDDQGGASKSRGAHASSRHTDSRDDPGEAEPGGTSVEALLPLVASLLPPSQSLSPALPRDTVTHDISIRGGDGIARGSDSTARGGGVSNQVGNSIDGSTADVSSSQVKGDAAGVLSTGMGRTNDATKGNRASDDTSIQAGDPTDMPASAAKRGSRELQSPAPFRAISGDDDGGNNVSSSTATQNQAITMQTQAVPDQGRSDGSLRGEVAHDGEAAHHGSALAPALLDRSLSTGSDGAPPMPATRGVEDRGRQSAQGIGTGPAGQRISGHADIGSGRDTAATFAAAQGNKPATLSGIGDAGFTGAAATQGTPKGITQGTPKGATTTEKSAERISRVVTTDQSAGTAGTKAVAAAGKGTNTGAPETTDGKRQPAVLMRTEDGREPPQARQVSRPWEADRKDSHRESSHSGGHDDQAAGQGSLADAASPLSGGQSLAGMANTDTRQGEGVAQLAGNTPDQGLRDAMALAATHHQPPHGDSTLTSMPSHHDKGGAPAISGARSTRPTGGGPAVAIPSTPGAVDVKRGPMGDATFHERRAQESDNASRRDGGLAAKATTPSGAGHDHGHTTSDSLRPPDSLTMASASVAPARQDHAPVKDIVRASTLLTPIVEGVVQQASLHTGAGISSFRVVLQPQALGMVTVHVEKNGQTLQITIIPQRAETGALLDHHASELAGLLQSPNLDSVNVSINVNTPAPSAHHTGAESAPPAPAASTGQGSFGAQGFAAGAGGQGFADGRQQGSAWTPRGITDTSSSVATVTTAGERGSIAAPRRMGRGAARIDIQV